MAFSEETKTTHFDALVVSANAAVSFVTNIGLSAAPQSLLGAGTPITRLR
jgi:hypothetical protein